MSLSENNESSMFVSAVGFQGIHATYILEGHCWCAIKQSSHKAENISNNLDIVHDVYILIILINYDKLSESKLMSTTKLLLVLS